MLGGIGHALVSAVEEAVFFHNIARCSQPDFQVKGSHPLTENYSVLKPEVTTGPGGQTVAPKNEKFLRVLLDTDRIIIAGQAKSHCVAWTIDDLLNDILAEDKKLAQKIYLLEDCSSPVVIPGVIDYTQQADEAFKRFENAGMHLVKSTDPMSTWPEITV
jgi:nicotinamidase-related amidase